MYTAVDFIFASKKLEKRFGQVVYSHAHDEIGGILFFDIGRINNMHWKRHQKIFGERAFAIITDWLICPNTSNLRDRMYEVSDLRQLIAIAEQSAETRGCHFAHFHTHPNDTTKPSEGDLNFWNTYFNEYGYSDGAIAAQDWLHGFQITHYSQQIRGQERILKSGEFLHWNWINYLLRRDAKKSK